MQIKVVQEIEGEIIERVYASPLNVDGWADGWQARIAKADDTRYGVVMYRLPALGYYDASWDAAENWEQHLAIMPHEAASVEEYRAWLTEQHVVEIWRDSTLIFEAPADSGDEPAVDLDTGELVDVADLAGELDYDAAMEAADLDPDAF